MEDSGQINDRRLKRKSIITRLGGRLTPETRGLARDSSLLSIVSVTTVIGYMVQVALISRVLGLREYGIFALAVAFVEIVSRFFDVQLADTAISFAAEPWTRGDAHETAGVFQFSYLVDLLTGVGAFFVVAALAFPVGSHFAGDRGPLLFLLYGLTLLGATVETTSFALLRVLNRLGVIIRLTLAREMMRIGAIAFVVIVFRSLTSVALSLVFLEASFGAAGLFLAARAFRTSSGLSLTKLELSNVRELRKPMVRMIIHTNFIAYAKMVSAQGPTLLLGLFRTPIEVGAYKVAAAIAAAVGKPGDPAWAAVMPRFSRLWTEAKTEDIRRLVTQATVIATVGLAGLAAVVLLLHNWLLELFGGPKATSASLVLVLLVTGKVINGALFWNSPLLYSTRRAREAARIYLAASLLLLPLLVAFVSLWGATGAAVAVLMFTIGLNVFLTIEAARVTRVSRGVR
jgi:O-antigen/teichoic acid export membrane protein